MCYTVLRKGVVRMRGDLLNLYQLPNIEEYEDLDLLSLSEVCTRLEDQVYAIAKSLPEEHRQVIDAYIHARNDLEVETVKTALRWGKRHYR